jgi:hypothetical protein
VIVTPLLCFVFALMKLSSQLNETIMKHKAIANDPV